MKRHILILIPVFLVFVALAWTAQTYLTERPAEPAEAFETEEEEGDKAKSIEFAFRDNFLRTLDPALGYPPYQKMIEVVQETRQRQRAYYNLAQRNGELDDVRWRERGPINIGGRTRVILIDERDPDRNKIWAGSVSGGLWYTEDITADPPQWIQVDDFMENLAVTALVQDPFNPEIMYLGTGEGNGNFDAVRGVGIFKSVDGGLSWSILPSTRNSNFYYTQKMLIHPQTGDLYAATRSGLRRSQDGGATWTLVLGSSVGFANDFFFDIEYTGENTNILYASNANSVFRSGSGDPNDWENLTGFGSNFPTGLRRVEIAIAPSSPNVLYMIGSNANGSATRVYSTFNGGQTWQARSLPDNVIENFSGGNGQAWYDLEIVVDPEDPNHVITGAVTMRRSLDGGVTWILFAPQTHVDHHRIIFDPERPNIIYNGNDGGIYRIVNITNVEDKNFGYNVTQFYAGAIHPEAGSNYILGGTQDNNSLQMTEFGISSGRSVRGGDGFACHIDEDEPNIQMVSSQFGNYGLSLNGGDSFSGGVSLNGGFYNPSDYDSESNMMYAQTFDGDFYRWNVNTGALTLVDVPGEDLSVSTVHVDPNVSNRVYFGVGGGRIYRVDNANTGAVANDFTELNPPVGGTVSSVDVELGDPDHLLVTVSNFGVPSVWESKDGGQTWTAHEGNLPDMPVRWGIFNPNDNTSAMIATEAGVWATDQLAGPNTEWLPPAPGRGTPLVRVDMLQLRRSDKVVLAATHGRGMFTTDVFSDAAVRMGLPNIAYTQAPVLFAGELSTGASSYFWELGDGTTSTEENVTHVYENFGTYPVTLTINDELTVDSTIKVLPDQTLPYIPDAEAYAGDFERSPEQYGADNITGSPLVRGQSMFFGKNGTQSGENAYVLAPEDEFYAPNTRAALYLPNFDFSDETIYEFSFWANLRIHDGFDGLRVEYSTDRGQSWQQLGTADAPNWYNYANNNLDQAAWEEGTSYFTGSNGGWTQYALNVSFLAGQPDVAFRFVFRSDNFGNHTGFAIDDVQITKFEGELATRLLKFEGEYTGPETITIDWTTEPEYKCVRFELMRSTDGRNFELIETLPATGGTTANLQSYLYDDFAQRNLYFYQLKVINEDPDIDYSFVFESPVIVVRRNIEGTDVLRLFPNPFDDRIEVTFNNLLEDAVDYALYDITGRLLQEGRIEPDLVFGSIQTGGNLAYGTYILVLDIEGEEKTFKLVGGGR